ncbi:MAG: hypothetical protein IPM42_12710 [Saprospiraceae bacterium]|nr:hypothetical protein [Saprospiraceae bacterium]
MGFLSSIKRLLFAQESVAKSAANKSVEYAKETGKEFAEKSEQVINEWGDKTAGLRDSVLEKAGSLSEKIKDSAIETYEKSKEVAGEVVDRISENEMVKKAGAFSEEVGSKIITTGENLLEKAGDVSEEVGSKILHTGSDLLHKAEEISESVGTKVLEVGGDAMEKAGTLSEKVGEKVIEVKDVLVEKAKQASENIGKQLDDVMEKAQKWEAEEAAKPKREFAEETLNTEKSLLDGKDDFFAKAAQYSDGHYDVFSEGKITIENSTPTPPRNPPAKAAGQDDLDGDGNELIDDAIIVKD